MANNPECFVLMPFGKKADQTGQTVDFDVIYLNLIVPALRSAGIEPVRWDDLSGAGPVNRVVFERLLRSDFVIADVSANAPNVFYELGVRHVMRERSTLLVAREGSKIPMDLDLLRVVRYRLNEVGRPENPQVFMDALRASIAGAVPGAGESPVYQLLEMEPPRSLIRLDATPAISLRGRATGLDWKSRIQKARSEGRDELRHLEADMTDVSPEVLVDMLRAYRTSGAWEDVVRLSTRLPASLSASPNIQEQLAMALNRTGHSDRAEAILRDLLKTSGPSSETYGILGRVYKDRWQFATKAGDSRTAEQALTLAIDSYVKGFETDWRDYYPGINAITLMEIRGEQDPRRDEMIPVVRYAVKRKLSKAKVEYWDYATLLELEVLANAQESANNALAAIADTDPASWQRESTASNLAIIRAARAQRGAEVQWIVEIEQRLMQTAGVA